MSKLTIPVAAGTPLPSSQASVLAGISSAEGISRSRKQRTRCRKKQTAEKRRSSPSGTLDANKDNILGAGQAAAQSNARRSTAISHRDGANLLHAAAFAAAIGMPLNRFLTVHTEAGGATDALKARARLAKLMHDWVRSKGGRFAHVTVRESGDGKGEHFHMLLHVPVALRVSFNRRQPHWLRAAGLKRRRGVAYSRPVGRYYYDGPSNVDDGTAYTANLGEALDYMLKGACAETRARLGVRRSEDGGTLFGKRCFHSENIGRTARSRTSLSPQQQEYRMAILRGRTWPVATGRQLGASHRTYRERT